MSSLPDPIVVATTSLHKLAELQTVARQFDLRLISPDDCRKQYSLGPWPEVEEVGSTFQENARIKAAAFFRWSGIASLGDDSGLEVDALEGRPGIFSARYAGEGASDRQRIAKVIAELKDLTSADTPSGRSARFRCSLALCTSPDEYLESDGSLEGYILQEPRGTGGFGYDPIVYINAIGSTLAEIDFERTCREGFRAIAAQKLFQCLKHSI